MNTITEKTRQIIKLFIDGHGYSDIANFENISKQRVEQIIIREALIDDTVLHRLREMRERRRDHKIYDYIINQQTEIKKLREEGYLYKEICDKLNINMEHLGQVFSLSLLKRSDFIKSTISKKCSRCQTRKPISEFTAKTGLIYPYCKPCYKSYRLQFRK